MMIFMKSQDTQDEASFFSHSSHKLKDSWKLWKIIGEREERIEYLLNMLKNKPNRGIWVLDAGSGHGAWSKLLGQKGYDVVGIDVSKIPMKNANIGCAIKNVSFLVGDLLEIPIKQETFHVCFCSKFLHHFRNVEDIIDELSRVILKGGEFLIYEPNESSIVYKLTELIKKFIPRKQMQIMGIDTINETIHSWKLYVNSLRAKGFKQIRIMFLESSEQESPFNTKTIATFLHTFGFAIGMVMSIRFLLFKMISKIPNQASSCGQVVIYSRKD